MKAPLLNLAVIGFVLLPSGIRAAGVIGTIDAGGQRTASASCTNVGSIGAIGSLAADASLTQIVKPGYVGQLFEATQSGRHCLPIPGARGNHQPAWRSGVAGRRHAWPSFTAAT